MRDLTTTSPSMFTREAAVAQNKNLVFLFFLGEGGGVGNDEKGNPNPLLVHLAFMKFVHTKIIIAF